MTLLALDQSSRVSGYAIFQNNDLVDYGKFICDDVDISQRLTKIRNKVKLLIDTYQPDVVALEDVQLQENANTFKILAKVLGVIQELLYELGIPQKTILASSWKSTLHIEGKQRIQQKHHAQRWVANMYNIEPSQDECDAICIGKHFLLKEMSQDWTN